MSVNTANPIENLLKAMDSCCEEHKHCDGCLLLERCRGLWDKASEEVFTRTFDCRSISGYIDEFNRLWREDEVELP